MAQSGNNLTRSAIADSQREYVSRLVEDSEKNSCFDCGAHLENAIYEPFLFRCYCGEFEHVRLCMACISSLSVLGEQPFGRLQHAYYANAFLSRDYVFDSDIDEDVPCTHEGDTTE